MVVTASGRAPLLALGFLSLVLGVAGGLARLTPELQAPAHAVTLHGALMVSAFFGTVISLERAVALGRLWAYAGPLAAGAGGACVVAGFPAAGFSLMVAAAAVLVAASAAVLRRQFSLEMGTLLAGAVAWLLGNLALASGAEATPWWIAFFVLTIGGERLELSRYLKRSPWAPRLFLLLAAAVLVLPLFPGMLGGALVLLALWLFVFDIARVTIRQDGLPRYIAACLLAGYFWLALGGALLAMSVAHDAALHALFVGFVFSMVFGHAPVILPAVLRVRYPYHPVLYVPLVLLHASLAVRALGAQEIGAWGNAAAIALFIVASVALVTTFDRRQARARVAQ